MNENLKTIKEIANELGVSKQAIQYHIKSLTNKNRQTNDKGIIVLSVEEQDFIRDRVDKQTNKTKTNNRQNSNKQNNIDYHQHLLNELEEVKKNRDKQLSVKDKQIENKDKQLAQMQNLLDQQQQLALQDKNLLEEYKSENDRLKALNVPTKDTQTDNQPPEELESIETEKQSAKKWYQFWRD